MQPLTQEELNAALPVVEKKERFTHAQLRRTLKGYRGCPVKVPAKPWNAETRTYRKCMTSMFPRYPQARPQRRVKRRAIERQIRKETRDEVLRARAKQRNA